MRRNSWTPDEEAWLREVYPTHYNHEIARMHAEAFPDLPERTDKAINSRAKVLHLRKADGFARNPKRFWTDEKAAWFRSFVPGHSESEISAEHERLYGTPLTEGQIGNAKSSLGVKSGTNGGTFRKGHAPANKGKKWSEFGTPEGHERSRATQFKQGHMNQRKGWMKPVGYERVDNDGYTWVKVKDGLQGKANDNYRLKHHVVWEYHNGPIPPSTQIVFADRDKGNFDPDNLVAVDRGIWSVISRSGMAYRDRASLEACMAVARLKRMAYGAEMGPRTCRDCGAEFEPGFKNQSRCRKCIDGRKKCEAANT